MPTPKNLEVLFDALNERPIAYQRVYSQIAGSVTAGLLLSQLLYWAKAMKYREFYKTDSELREETGLGSKELRNAKKTLSEFVEMNVRGVPPKTYYNIKKDLIIEKILNLTERDKLKWPKGTNQSDRNGENDLAERDKIYTENTSENNTENTSDTPGETPEVMSAGAVVNLLIGEFEPINPSFRRLYKNKTQRSAIENLLKQYDFTKLQGIIRFLQKTNGKRYAPTITTPCQLEERLGALIAYCDKAKDGASQKEKEIIGL